MKKPIIYVENVFFIQKREKYCVFWQELSYIGLTDNNYPLY